MLRRLVLSLLLLSAWPTRAAHIELRSAAPGITGRAQLRLQRVAGESSAPSKVDASGDVPSVIAVDLTPGTWQVEVQGGMWAESQVVDAAGEVAIDVWPTGVIRGTFRSERASSMRIAFESAVPMRGPRAPSAITNCTVDADRWSCAVPALPRPQQLRLMPSGAAPVFLWDQKIVAGAKLDAGAIDVRPGAAVAGVVTVATKTRIDLATTNVSLTPAGAEGERALYTIHPGARGTFVFAGVTPGDYELRAWRRDLVAAPTRVRVLPRLTAHLQNPLVLDVPRHLLVAVTPPVSPSGSKWLVQLAASRNIVTQGPAAEDGTWTSPPLSPGTYRVEVRTVDGSQWDAKEIVVDEPNERVALTVPLVHATGTVTLDGKPIQAKLTLSQFGRSIIQTSEEGTFAATLPGAADGKWQIEIESEKPAVTSQLHDFRARVTDAGAVFDIVVPRTLIAGRCVDAADQSPLPHAIIDIQSVDAHTFRQTFAAPDGTFEAIGLPPGKYHVSAKDFLKESTAVEVEIGDDPVTDLVLALRPQLEFKGRLFAANGSPIPHARIYGRPADRNGAGLLADADTDGAGGFDLVLPPGTSAFDLLIAAPGFALSLARTQFSAEGVVPMYADQNGGHLNVSAKTIGRVQLRHGGAQWHAGLLARFNGGTYDMSAGIVHSGLVEAGPWSACIAEKCVSGFLAPGGELQLTLED